MGSLGDELSLGSMAMNVAMKKGFKLEDYVKMLEDEKKKIEISQLELPLCLEVLNNAICYMKEEYMRCLEMDVTKPLLKDLISFEKPIREGDGIDKREEKKFQKWKVTKIKNKLEVQKSEEKSSMLLIPGMRTPKVETGLGLGLTSSSMVNEGRKVIASCGFTSKPMPKPQQPPFLHQQGLRKQRRCWTPELHRRFVDALPHLGGPGVATPKQIREYMQEEGLTNDEVKSHLQKYRLHIRNLNSKQEKQSAVVLGFNLWKSSQEVGGSNLQSDSPQGPLQLPSITTTTCGDTKSESF